MEISFPNFEEFKKTLVTAISTGGYFVKIDNPPAIRTPFTLYFTIQGSKKNLELKTEVVFVGGGGVGLNFTESVDNIKQKLADYVKNLAVPPGHPEPAPPAQQPPQHKFEGPEPQADPEEQISQTAFPPPPAEEEEQIEETPPTPVSTEPVPARYTIRGKMLNTLKIESKKGPGKKDPLADFGDLSFTKILINVFEGKSSGIIKFKTGEVEKIVYFRGGRPVFVESNPPLVEESIGNILLAKEKIKKEHLDGAIKYVENHGVRIGEALMAIKAVSPTLLKDALTFQLKVKLYEIFKWKEADFEMEVMQKLDQRFGTRPINVITVIYKGLKEKLKELYAQDLEQYIAPIYDKFLTQKVNPLFDLENLSLNAHEKRFWDLMLTGRRRVREIFAGSTMNKPDTFRFLYALLELDLVEIHDHAVLDIPNIERDIYNQARFMEKMDYFEVLAIHWTANREKIEESYKNHLEEILEKKKIPKISPETVVNIDKMAQVLKKAADYLSNDSARREYRKQILGETEAKVAAELAAKQAQLMEFRSDFKEARLLVEVAIDLDPSNSEYRNLMARYRGKR